jgi:hypothetical protein
MLEEQIEEHIRHTRDGFLIVWLAVRACGSPREFLRVSRARRPLGRRFLPLVAARNG